MTNFSKLRRLKSVLYTLSITLHTLPSKASMMKPILLIRVFFFLMKLKKLYVVKAPRSHMTVGSSGQGDAEAAGMALRKAAESLGKWA